MQISLSWYQVKDLEKAKKFYGEVLGLDKTFEVEGWAEFSHTKDGPAVGLSQVSEADAPGGATVVLRVDDLDVARKALSKKGVEFEGDVKEIPGIVRIGSFRDPSGNRLQLCQVLMPN
jgi:predicted enzyme related to lactoylglutathione lyase